MNKYEVTKLTLLLLFIFAFHELYAQISNVTENTDPIKLYEKFELTINLAADYSNPFDPENIDLWASFSSPSSVNWNRINGFWDGSNWKIRFAGNEIGVWSYSVYFDDGTDQYDSTEMTFEIIESEHHGWIRVSDTDPHYLEYSDGTSFYGTGQCRAWDINSASNIFTEMKLHKMNILHYWMPSWDNILITDSTGYDMYDMGHAEKIDEVVENCENNGIALILTIWNHHELRGEGHPWPRHYFDEYNPFRNLSTLSEFFTDSVSLQYQEKLYRYIIARWGYSQAIGLWQTVCEIDGISNSWNNDAITDPWHVYINNYFKEHDPFHHIATASKSNDAWLWSNGFSIIDVAQIHTFSDELNITHDDIVSEIANRTKTVWNDYNKPVFIGEFADEGDYNQQQPNYLHDGIWSGLASGGAIIPLDWNDGESYGDFTDDMYDHVYYLSKFVEPLQLNKRKILQSTLNTDSEFSAYGIIGELGIIWIKDNSPGELNSGKTLSVSTNRNGKYTIDWYNTWNGELYNEKSITISSSNLLNLIVPDFSKDIAARVTFAGEWNQNITYLNEINVGEDAPFRWKDIGDNIFDINYQNKFSYSQSRVFVSFDPISPSFKGILIGYDLKPNFAYQIKLVGKPEKEWGSEGDDISNEKIGFEGRWWRLQPNPGNSNDTDYLAHKDDPEYIYEGYLLFDYLVTNESGYVLKEFEADNSFHVLWNNVINTRLPGTNDSPVSFHEVYASIQNDIYSNPLSPDIVGLYGEWEPSRELPGELELSPGEYNVRIVLTEESFHQSGIGGNWVTVMSNDDINFNIVSDTSGFLDCKIYLEGSYSILFDSMSTSLNVENIPLTQPYNSSPWNYNGNESVYSIPADVVDWILVELRDKDDTLNIKSMRAGFLLKNGKIVDLDGTNPIRFNIVEDSYYIVVKHRNHLSVMSKNPIYIK